MITSPLPLQLVESVLVSLENSHVFTDGLRKFKVAIFFKYHLTHIVETTKIFVNICSLPNHANVVHFFFWLSRRKSRAFRGRSIRFLALRVHTYVVRRAHYADTDRSVTTRRKGFGNSRTERI